MEERNLWWGYKHISGTYQVKRYFDRRDIDDANESSFCEIVFPPFYAENREEALKQIQNIKDE
jgi:hypothetical protein